MNKFVQQKKNLNNNFVQHKKKMKTQWKFAIAFAVAGLLVIATLLRQQTLSDATVTKLKDIPRSGQAVVSDFYVSQLKEKEKAAYDLMKEKLEKKEGGVVEFPKALNGKEYTRVVNALEFEGGNNFYGLYEIPMTEDDVYVKYIEDDIVKLQDPVITKAILFLSSAEKINEQGKYSDDGTVTNLEEVAKGLSVNSEDKLAEIDEIQKKTEQILDEVIKGLPEDYGEKKTVDYFLEWMDKNLEFFETDEDAADMSEMFERFYRPNHLAAVVDKKANATGYAKILAELCNRAGMESHIVMGQWKGSWLSGESYVLCAVSMNDQTIYVDASGAKAGVLADHKYLTEKEAKNHMDFVEYFEY